MGNLGINHSSVITVPVINKVFHYSLCFCAILLCHQNTKAQETVGQLDLKDQGLKIQNRIELQISSSEFQRIKKITGLKIQINKVSAAINDHQVEIKNFHTRGKTTLYLRRKSYSFNASEKVTFQNGEQFKSMKKFYAISLSMDKNYMRNKLSFDLLDKLQLFELFHTYCELRINGQSEGIYLIVERPQDWALKTNHSPLVLRRGFDQKIEKIKLRNDNDKLTAKKYKGYYKSIYNCLGKYKGEELYSALSEKIDIEMYMTWLAFNFFVRNGDYTDEVYFYIDPENNKYKIIPWDYDDIFASAPHEGMAVRKSDLGDKYIFSSEDKLDKAIANDPFLYERYLVKFQEMLEVLTEEKLKSEFEKIYTELYPYYRSEEIISMSEYDAYKLTNLANLENELHLVFQQLAIFRQTFLNNPR